MKKIFTLLFSLGLLSSVFAQTGNHQNQNNGNSHQYASNNRTDHDSGNSSTSFGHDNSQQWKNYDNKDQYAYNGDDRERKFDRRDDHFDHVINERRADSRYAQPVIIRLPLVRILFGALGR